MPVWYPDPLRLNLSGNLLEQNPFGCFFFFSWDFLKFTCSAKTHSFHVSNLQRLLSLLKRVILLLTWLQFHKTSKILCNFLILLTYLRRNLKDYIKREPEYVHIFFAMSLIYINNNQGTLHIINHILLCTNVYLTLVVRVLSEIFYRYKELN